MTSKVNFDLLYPSYNVIYDEYYEDGSNFDFRDCFHDMEDNMSFNELLEQVLAC